jgi:hypothetical protein
MKYYLFNYGVNNVGTYPQTRHYTAFRDYNENAETSMLKLRRDRFPDVKPDLRFILQKGANLSNFVAPSNMGRSSGIMMDKKMYALFSKYKLYNARFYEASVIYRATKYDYYWLHVVFDRYDPAVDFSKTTYIEVPNNQFNGIGVKTREGCPELIFKNIDDYLEAASINFNLSISKLILTSKFLENEYDFFAFTACFLSPRYFISERLYNDLLSAQPTGCSFDVQNVLEEYSYP